MLASMLMGGSKTKPFMSDFGPGNYAMTRDSGTSKYTDTPYSDPTYGSLNFFKTGTGIGSAGNFTVGSGISLGDFQFDGWVKFSEASIASTDNTLQLLTSATAFLLTMVLRGTGTAPTFEPRIINSGVYMFSGSYPMNAWNYLSCGRSGTTMYVYVNNTKTTSTIASTAIDISNQKFTMGYSNSSAKDLILFTDLRLSKIARDFNTRTIPTAPLASDSNTLFLIR